MTRRPSVVGPIIYRSQLFFRPVYNRPNHTLIESRSTIVIGRIIYRSTIRGLSSSVRNLVQTTTEQQCFRERINDMLNKIFNPPKSTASCHPSLFRRANVASTAIYRVFTPNFRSKKTNVNTTQHDQVSEGRLCESGPVRYSTSQTCVLHLSSDARGSGCLAFIVVPEIRRLMAMGETVVKVIFLS